MEEETHFITHEVIKLIQELAEFAEEQGADWGLWYEEWEERGLGKLIPIFKQVTGK